GGAASGGDGSGDGGSGSAFASSGSEGEFTTGTGAGPGAGGSGGAGCDRVDIVFGIDNSPSMAPHQQALAEAFPKFVQAIYEKLPDKDLHVGITTSSFFVGATAESYANCQTTATSAYIAQHYVSPAMSDDGENGGQGRLFVYDDKPF